jgi:hypothetical protein
MQPSPGLEQPEARSCAVFLRVTVVSAFRPSESGSHPAFTNYTPVAHCWLCSQSHKILQNQAPGITKRAPAEADAPLKWVGHGRELNPRRGALGLNRCANTNRNRHPLCLSSQATRQPVKQHRYLGISRSGDAKRAPAEADAPLPFPGLKTTPSLPRRRIRAAPWLRDPTCLLRWRW